MAPDRPPVVERVAYEFGDCLFEPFNARLICANRAIPLQAKAAGILLLLVERPDELVTKDELMTAVWPDTIVHENNLNQQIAALRRLLPRLDGTELIQTVARRGYRFAAPVRVIKGERPNAPAAPAAAADSYLMIAGGGRRPLMAAAALGTFIVVTAGGDLIDVRQARQEPVATSSNAIEHARQLLRSGDAPGAVTELQTLISREPDNAQAYSDLAHALHKYSFQTHRTGGATPALEAARRGVELDPRCASCQGMLGFLLFYHDWQWAPAEEHLLEAIRLDPEAVSIRPSYAMLLLATGRATQALEQIDFALTRRTYEIVWHGIRASILYLDRRYADAIAAADRALAINDKDRAALEWRSKALFQLGRGEEAVQALAETAFANHASSLERAVQEKGVKGGLLELLRITGGWTQRDEQAWRRGAWHAMLNDNDGALTELETALARRSFNVIYIGLDPVYDAVRMHPRFQRVLEGLGLSDRFTAAVNGR